MNARSLPLRRATSPTIDSAMPASIQAVRRVCGQPTIANSSAVASGFVTDLQPADVTFGGQDGQRADDDDGDDSEHSRMGQRRHAFILD